MSWHLDAAQLSTYANGSLVGARAASVEAHLLRCSPCRSRLAPAASPDRLSAVWAEIEERVDSPRKTWLEKLLIRVRVPAEEARLLAAAPSLKTSWLASLALVLTFAAAATHGGERGVLLFLLLAPLVPVAAVAGAYGRGIDPTYEITRSTSYPTYRLLLLRVAAVLVVSLVLTSLVSFAVSAAWVGVAWLLPALAMVGVVMVLTRWVDLPMSSGIVVSMYAAAVLLTYREGGTVRALFEAPAQLGAFIVTMVCLSLLVLPSANRSALRRVP